MHGPGCDRGPLQAHHVVSQQHLRKRGLWRLQWDVRIGVCVCEEAHRRHTLAVERLSRDVLSPATVALIESTPALDGYLDRYYR